MQQSFSFLANRICRQVADRAQISCGVWSVSVRTSGGGAGGGSGGAYFWMFRWPDALPAEGCLRREMANVSRAVQERVIFTNLLPHEEKIRGKGAADIFLDTPEYNAHGTATEVLSGGGPVLTLPGSKAHSSRVAASVILALGLPELVARTIGEYENIAVRLALDASMYRCVCVCVCVCVRVCVYASGSHHWRVRKHCCSPSS